MAALLGLGADPAVIEDLPTRLGVPNARISWECDGTTSEVQVLGAEDSIPTDYRGLLDRVRTAGLPSDLRDIALRVLQDREVAEAHLLGVDLARHVFVEEAVADTLIDVVGGVLLWAALDRPTVSLGSPIVAGDPPRPSSVSLLEGMPYRSGGAALPLVTPTGAALLRAVWQPGPPRGEAIRAVDVPGDFSRSAGLPPLRAALHAYPAA